MDTKEEQALEIHLPFKEAEMRKLLMEYLRLYETIQQLKVLARINVDLLHICTAMAGTVECQEEVVKVQRLIDTLMNGKEVFRIAIANSEEVVTEGCMDFGEDQTMLEGLLCNTSKIYKIQIGNSEEEGSFCNTKGHENDCNGSQDSDCLDGDECKSKEVTEAEEPFKDLEELPIVCKIQEMVSAPTRTIKHTLNNSPSKQRKNSKHGKVESAITVESNNKKPLKNRLELEQVLDSQESHNGFGLRICKFCDRLFDGRDTLGLHLVTHLENKRHVCRYCGKEYDKRAFLEKHLLLHQDTSQTSMKEGEETSTPSEVFEPTSNGLFSKDYENIELKKRQPASINQENDVFVDSNSHHIPKKPLKNRLELEQYLESPESHDCSKSRICKFCGCRFKGKLSLSNHLVKAHLEDKRLICNLPGMKLKTKSSLGSHIEPHTEGQAEKTLVCDICGKVYKSESALERHKLWVHVKGTEACKVCGKMISTINIPRHMIIHTGDKPFKCSVCHRAFNRSSIRNAHQKRHNGQYPHNCSDCGVLFNTYNALKIHEKTHLRNKQFSCSGCDKSFTSEALATAHTEELGQSHTCKLTEKKKIKYKCSYCNKLFVKSVHLAQHLFSIHKKLGEIAPTPYLTDSSGKVENIDLEKRASASFNQQNVVCNSTAPQIHKKPFKNRVELEKYLQSLENHHGSEFRICEFCGCRRIGKSSLSSHLAKEHLEDKRHICEHCGKDFKIGYYLKEHLLLHQGNTKVECSDCGKEFSSKHTLCEHKKRIHFLNHEWILCSICGVKLKTKSSLHRHIKTHAEGHAEGMFICNVCGKACKSEISLKSHKRGKHIIGTEACKVCGKMISQVSMRRHMLRHTGLKPYKCLLCNKAFNRNCELNAHLKRHTGQHLHNCSDCGVGFNTYHALKIHENAHVRTKLFSCSGCDKFFTSEVLATAHTEELGQTHTCALTYTEKRARKFKCSYCNELFAESGDFATHLFSVHNKELKEEVPMLSWAFEKSLNNSSSKDGNIDIEEGASASINQENDDFGNSNPHQTIKKALLQQENMKYESSECGRELSSEHTLYQRKKLTLHEFVLCFICGMKLKSKSSLLRHMKTHTEDQTKKTFVCDICGKVYNKRMYLQRHKRCVHIKGTEACKICGKMITQANIPRHMLIHTGDKPYKCSVCYRAFNQSNERNIHQKRHTGQYPHYCFSCGVGFNTIQALRIHEATHTRKKEFLCSSSDCDKSFMSEALATAHTEELGQSHSCTVSYITEKRVTKYNCPDCSKVFTDRVSIAKHLFSKHNKELDRCLLCLNDERFSSSVDLESHMTSLHFNEKPFKCRTCGESFYMFGNFYAHQTLLLHSNKKPLKCNDCNKSFYSHRSWKNHCLLKHSLEPVKTPSCDMQGAPPE